MPTRGKLRKRLSDIGLLYLPFNLTQLHFTYPQQATQGRQAAHSYLPLTIQVTIKDASNRVIDSMNKVPVTWETTSSELGVLEKQEGVFVGSDTRDGVLQPGGAHQVNVLDVANSKLSLPGIFNCGQDWGD